MIVFFYFSFTPHLFCVGIQEYVTVIWPILHYTVYTVHTSQLLCSIPPSQGSPHARPIFPVLNFHESAFCWRPCLNFACTILTRTWPGTPFTHSLTHSLSQGCTFCWCSTLVMCVSSTTSCLQKLHMEILFFETRAFCFEINCCSEFTSDL